MELIVARNLSKVYPNRQGIHSASFSLERGEFVGVLGPSGAGKSTLLRLLCGALFPTQGSLTLWGQELQHLNRRQLLALRNRIATVYQNYNVISSIDVARNVLMGRAGKMSHLSVIRGMFKLTPKEEQEIKEVLTVLDIQDKFYEKGQELSGGQQQRVAVARAIYSKAELILADEPIASVDPATAELILNAFSSLQKEGKTILVSLHQLESALKYCSRIIAFEQGEVVYDGSPQNFIKSTALYKLKGTSQNQGGAFLNQGGVFAEGRSI